MAAGFSNALDQHKQVTLNFTVAVAGSLAFTGSATFNGTGTMNRD